MTTPHEQTGLDRRTLLKRTAAAGGTLLWAAPTVTALSAWHPAVSAGPCDDGTDLDADFYILAIQCGSGRNATFYLVKVTKDPSRNKHFLVHCGGQITGSLPHGDRNGSLGRKTKPSKNDSNPSLTALSSSHRWVPETTGCPPDVGFCVYQGDLVVDLDKDNDGHACRILGWVRREGDDWRAGSWIKGPYDPLPLDPDYPYRLRFQAP